ncbi:hypothetical protein B0H11DRAFT_2027711, partial [Mycena galericulata]
MDFTTCVETRGVAVAQPLSLAPAWFLLLPWPASSAHADFWSKKCWGDIRSLKLNSNLPRTRQIIDPTSREKEPRTISKVFQQELVGL